MRCSTENEYYLKDRLNMKFKIMPDNVQTVTTIFNSKTTSISPKDFKIDCARIDIIDESIEEINNIIGIIGQLTDEKYNKYYWELSDDSGIEVTYYSGDTGTISVDFDNKVLKNEKVDFYKYDEIKSQLDSGQSLTYDEFVTKVGGVQGILIEKSEYNKVFIWVANDDSYLKATFSESTGKCTFIVGFVY